MIRSTYLQNQGFTILGFWNNDVLFNMNGVIERIIFTLTPTLSLGEREKGEV